MGKRLPGTITTANDHAPHDLQRLFSPGRIGGLTLRNRIVALPLFTGYAHPDGKVSPLLTEHYGRLAGSGAAVVVVGNAAVSAGGATSRCSLRVHSDAFVPGLTRLARTIRKEGALACLQLNHGGPFAKNGRPLVPSPMDGAYLIHDIASMRAFMETFPVRMRFGLTRQLMDMVVHWQRAMTDDERQEVVADFGKAAHRAYEAGFDMVELHGGTGYLLAAYLSAYTNKIPSGFGGSGPERATFPLQVIDAVKGRVPEGFPVGFRLMVREWVPDGVDLDEAIRLARMLEARGVDYLSVTAGTYNGMFKPEVVRITARPAHLGKDTAALKNAVRCPVIISGRVFTPTIAARVLRQGQADLIGLARPLLADPEWLHKAASHRKVMVCINCGNCLERVIGDEGVTCVRWPRVEQERIDLETSILSRRLSKEMLVAANLSDLRLIRATWQSRMPHKEDVSVRILFLKRPEGDTAFEAAIGPFLEWAGSVWRSRGIAGGQLDHATRITRQAFDKKVIEETEKEAVGVILLGMHPEEPWRGRLASKHTTGVIGFLASHPRPTKVLVPVDLTTVSLLLLRYIHHAYDGKPEFAFAFVHATNEAERKVRARWRDILGIQGWDGDTALKLIPFRDSVVQALLDEMRAGAYGTVIMGRRNISGVRRWLLGSVSAGMMQGVTDQNITLVG